MTEYERTVHAQFVPDHGEPEEVIVSTTQGSHRIMLGVGETHEDENGWHVFLTPDRARRVADTLRTAADVAERPKTRTVLRIERFSPGWGYPIAIWKAGDGRVKGWYDGGHETAEQARDRDGGWGCGPCDGYGKEYASNPAYLRALASIAERPTEEVPA